MRPCTTTVRAVSGRLLDRACLDWPQRQAEPRLLAYLDRQIDGLLAELPDSHRVGDAVKRCMKDQLRIW